MRLAITKLLGAGLVALGLTGFANTTRADPIGPDCAGGSCFGIVYTLQDFLVDPTDHVYNFILFADTSGYNGGGVAIQAAAFKVTSQSNTNMYDTGNDPHLLTAPGTLGNWGATHFGGVNANGCQDNTDGFLCNQTSNPSGDAPVPDGLYKWVWQVDYVNTPTLIDPASIKLLFVNAQGQQSGITSENIHLQACDLPEGCTPQKIPEPGSLALLGALALGFGLFRRSRHG